MIEQTASAYGSGVFDQDGETWVDLLRLLHEFEADERPPMPQDVYRLLDDIYDLLSAAWVYVDFDRPRAEPNRHSDDANPSQSPLGEPGLTDTLSVELDVPAAP